MTVTTQRTAKGWKLFKAVGVLSIFFSLTAAWAGWASAFLPALAVGVGLIILGRVGTWWFHE